MQFSFGYVKDTKSIAAASGGVGWGAGNVNRQSSIVNRGTLI